MCRRSSLSASGRSSSSTCTRTAPHRAGHRLARLVELSKHGLQVLGLWMFQPDVGARRLRERHGFVATGTTTGDDDEGAPEVAYEWQGG